MYKAELTGAIASKMGVTKKVAEQFIETFQEVIIDELSNGGYVKMVGFGSFEVKNRAARKGYNPATKTEIEIPASKTPKFKAGKILKDAVNE